jgi:hypothetical protein
MSLLQVGEESEPGATSDALPWHLVWSPLYLKMETWRA